MSARLSMTHSKGSWPISSVIGPIGDGMIKVYEIGIVLDESAMLKLLYHYVIISLLCYIIM